MSSRADTHVRVVGVQEPKNRARFLIIGVLARVFLARRCKVTSVVFPFYNGKSDVAVLSRGRPGRVARLVRGGLLGDGAAAADDLGFAGDDLIAFIVPCI